MQNLTEKTLQNAIDYLDEIIKNPDKAIKLERSPTICSLEEFNQIKHLPEKDQELALWKNRFEIAGIK